jgi:hypothetical protein
MQSSAHISVPFWTPEMLDSVKKNEFRLLFSSEKAEITGILVVKNINNVWRGAIINEFGIKVFDFQTAAKDCKLMNVISFMDKWYIKKEMASDLQFIMEIDNSDYKIGCEANRKLVDDTLVVTYKKEKELQRLPNGEIIYKNHKRNLTYSLKKITATNYTN